MNPSEFPLTWRYTGSLKIFCNSLGFRSLYPDILSVIKRNNNLPSNCVGKINQNNNESFNQLVWEIITKALNRGSTILNTTAYIEAGASQEYYMTQE